MKHIWGFLYFLSLPILVHAGNVSEEQGYISDKIVDYEKAIERCEILVSDRPLPSADVLESLRAYDPAQIRVFLITRSAYLLEECQKPELTELAYAIGVLDGAQVTGETRKILDNIAPLVFGKEAWGLKKRYLQLPENMRDTLELVEYFREPFDDLDVLEGFDANYKP